MVDLGAANFLVGKHKKTRPQRYRRRICFDTLNDNRDGARNVSDHWYIPDENAC